MTQSKINVMNGLIKIMSSGHRSLAEKRISGGSDATHIECNEWNEYNVERREVFNAISRRGEKAFLWSSYKRSYTNLVTITGGEA